MTRSGDGLRGPDPSRLALAQVLAARSLLQAACPFPVAGRLTHELWQLRLGTCQRRERAR